MKRIRRIGSYLTGERNHKRPITNDKLTLLPNEVHSTLGKYLSHRDLQSIMSVNRTLFKSYVMIAWQVLVIRNTDELIAVAKIVKLVSSGKAMHDYFSHVHALAFDLWTEMDRGKEVARIVLKCAAHQYLRTVSIRIGAAWGEVIQQSLTMLPRHCNAAVGISTRRLIGLDLNRCGNNLKSVQLKVDFGNVSWLAPLSRSVETLYVEPDAPNQRQLKARDCDLRRAMESAKYLRKLSFDWVCIQSDGMTSWVPASVTELTLKRCTFDVYCFDDDDMNDSLPQAESVTKLTVHGGENANQNDELDQVFMQFPRLHTLHLVSEYGNPLEKTPIDSADMENLQCLVFTGYGYRDVVNVVMSSNRMPATTLKLFKIPNGLWIPQQSIYEEILQQLPALQRLVIDCSALQYEHVPFTVPLRMAITQLFKQHKGHTDLILDSGGGDAEAFTRLLLAGGIEIMLEETPEPPLQRLASFQGKQVHGNILIA